MLHTISNNPDPCTMTLCSCGASALPVQPKPVPLSQVGLQALTDVSHAPHKHRLIAPTKLKDWHDHTHLHTSGQWWPHFLLSSEAAQFITAMASVLGRPSAENTRGVKWLHCLRQGSRCLSFFSFSCVARPAFSGSWPWLDGTPCL